MDRGTGGLVPSEKGVEINLAHLSGRDHNVIRPTLNQNGKIIIIINQLEIEPQHLLLKKKKEKKGEGDGDSTDYSLKRDQVRST